jgi:hypothetical protein
VSSIAVNPELVQRDISKAIMLAEVGELLVDMAAYIAAVDYPDRYIASLVNLLYVWRFH